jgi:hypoxanthine phosphoribosyltransferase
MQRAGLDVFFAPLHVRPGWEWQPQLNTQLKMASALVAIFTPRSISNSWVMAECSATWILGVPVFSFAMFTPMTDLPAFASSLQARVIETPEQLSTAILEVKEHLESSTQRTNTWSQVSTAMIAIDQKLRDLFVPTDLVVGSGRGGAICGAIIASRRGIPLKVCDLQKGTARDVDLSPLAKGDFKGRHILVVEYYRNTGTTFDRIRKQLLRRGAESVYSVALLCKEAQRRKVNVFAEKVQSFIRPPWQTNV